MRPRQTHLGTLGSDEIPSTLAELSVDFDAAGGQELRWQLAALQVVEERPDEHLAYQFVGFLDTEGDATRILR